MSDHSSVSEAFAMTAFSCCRGFNARLLFLLSCAIIEYTSHTVILLLAPMISMHFFPNTAYSRVGFYSAILCGAGFLGHMLSCRVWINVAKRLNSSKGIILWGLAIIGTGFFSLLLCQSFLAMAIVRFTTGLFSGVIPVALIQIDSICGNQQAVMARTGRYLGILLGSVIVFSMVLTANKMSETFAAKHDESALYFYPLAVVSMLSWIAVVVMLVGLKMRSRSSYIQVAADDDESFGFEDTTALEESTSPMAPSASTGPAGALDRVKSAFEEAFGKKTTNTMRNILKVPNPHFRSLRAMLPHYYHGYSSDGHVVIWDLLGQMKMDRLHSAGFTTYDIREHYEYFIAYALEHLRSGTSQRIIYIIDLEGLSLAEADDRAVESAGSILSALQDVFPNSLEKMVIINAPSWISHVMSRLQPFVSQRSFDKVVLVQKDEVQSELLQLIGVDALPRKYGGQNAIELGKSSQERSLKEHLAKTTGQIEQTKEIVGGQTAEIKHRSNSCKSFDAEDSDDEAFFDSLEYGLQDELDEDISIVIHSQNMKPTTEVQSRPSASPPKPNRANPSVQVFKVDHPAPSDAVVGDVAISREPHACLILGVYFFWLLIQVSFDELIPLWFFRHNVVSNRVSPTPSSASVVSLTMQISLTILIVSASVLVAQLIFSMVFRNTMTPLASLRLGVLLQVPVFGVFPLLDVFHLDELSFGLVLVVILILAKNLTASISLSGIVSLLDNSIAVDRRLAVHRASHIVKYTATFFGSSAAPAIFALLGYFERSFPFDQSLLYFVHALGLTFLFFFSFVIPAQLNFPRLFVMGKR